MNKLFKVIIIVLAFVLLLVLFAGVYLITFMPNISPAPQLNVEKTTERIERGKYLAHHVTVCMDCHSSRDWSKFSAPLAGQLGAGGEIFNNDMGFPGTIYSLNITPYNLQHWTDGEIFRTITTGVDKDGKALFSVMPYHNYGKMDKEDIYSIIAYIRTLDAIDSEVPERKLEFPVNLLVNLSPQEASFSTIPDESDRIAYGGYLINAAGCVHCHSQTEQGAIVPGTEYGGGMEFVQPAGIVRGANITMHKTKGIGTWTMESFVKRFKHYADSSYVPEDLKPTDWNTPMPWTMYAGMKVSDLEAIYTYLSSLEPKDNTVVKFSPHKR
ncbi:MULTISPECIES: c-type cytochrome [Sphingobacterium]|uniref:C-type cytochrome n=1 Tax=Sphingobacterium litopenaei TaxID=2763500 RepID=A0ABR7YFT2_9SPHI|nr:MULTISPECIES: c-type cytochrome [Sphingobacterium]MBD1430165.1 c-type cytochrome [Sphingobacterium litopenaei]NGM72957.1 c-type cytochrome [Sphingobacterium sp. SGL-16]